MHLTLNNLLILARAYEALIHKQNIENQKYGAGTNNVNVVKKYIK